MGFLDECHNVCRNNTSVSLYRPGDKLIQVQVVTHDFHHEPSFMEKYPWATPVIVLAFFFTFVGILYYCMYKNCREYLRPWRQPTVVVIQAPPNGTTNVQYPGYPGNTNFQVVPGNNQGGINMPSAPGAYTGGSNINADPPPYRVVVDGSQNTKWTQK